MNPQHKRATEPVVLELDDAIAVIDKPSGVLSTAGRGPEPSLPDLLRARRELRDIGPLRIVHRLDRDASGVIVYARQLEAQRSLVAQFEQRRVEKVYLALVSGYVEADGEVTLPLFYHKRLGHMVTSTRRGKDSLTRYRILERLPGNTLLECRPLTGRQHQIRVHLAAIGHPLTVDPEYGGGERVLLSQYKSDYRPSRRRPERPLIERLTLHATRITFEHPRSGRPVTYESPIPRDLQATLRQLGRLI